MITIQGLEPGARMVCRLEALDFFPTDAEWTPIADVRTVEEGKVLQGALLRSARSLHGCCDTRRHDPATRVGPEHV